MESFRQLIEAVYDRHTGAPDAEDHLQRLMRLGDQMQRLLAERSALAEQRAAQLRRLAIELTHAEQRERRRLAQVLHDDLQQLLVAAKVHLRVLRNRCTDEALRPLGDHVEELLQQATYVSRSLTTELTPPLLNHSSLCEALRWLAQWMHERHGLMVTVEGPNEVALADSDMLPLLFQAVRELLLNVVKHAQVLEASVEVCVREGEVHVEVIDNGVGVDVSRIDGRQGCSLGFGLFGIRERLDCMGGRLELFSIPGQGTRVLLRAPALTAATEPAEQPGPPVTA